MPLDTQSEAGLDESPEASSLYTIPGVELFAPGTHKKGTDKEATFTDADLDDIIANYEKFSTGSYPQFSPAAFIGHEDDQSLLNDTGIAACGWPTNLRKESGKLICDLSDVPHVVKDWIDRGMFRKVSAEIYDDPSQAGLEGSGRMFRRVGLLGAEPPEVKGLADLPLVHHLQKRPVVRDPNVKIDKRPGDLHIGFSEIRRLKPGSVHVFSEVRPMPDAGSPQAKAMWAKVSLSDAKKKDGSYSKSKMKKGTPKGGWGFSEESGAMDDNTLSKQAIELGIPETIVQKVGPEDLKALCEAVGGADEMSEEQPPATTADKGSKGQEPGDKDEGAKLFAECVSKYGEQEMVRRMQAMTKQTGTENEGTVAQMNHLMSEMRREVIAVRGELAAEKNLRSINRKEEARKRVHTFCEEMVEKRLLRPADVDPSAKTVNKYHLLMAASTEPVHKFAEGYVSQLDMMMAEIRNGVPHKFSESVRNPAGGSNADDRAAAHRLMGLMQAGRGLAVLEKNHGKEVAAAASQSAKQYERTTAHA